MKLNASIALAIGAATHAVIAQDGFIGQDSKNTESKAAITPVNFDTTPAAEHAGRVDTSLEMTTSAASPSFDLTQHQEEPASSKALFSSSKVEHTQYIMPFAGYRTPTRSEMASTGSPRRRANRSSPDKTCGSSVEPGTPLSKVQQEARRDSKIGPLSLEGAMDNKPQTMRESFAELATKMRLDSPQLDIFIPDAHQAASAQLLRDRRRGNLRALIIFVIFFLIVFGAVYSLVEYLLLAARASATCTPSTVYVPVTRYISTAAVNSASDDSTTRLTIYSTVTMVETQTSSITMQPSVMATGLTSSGGPSYYFTVNSAGSTDWLNGVSPPATASLTIITRSIFVTPVMPSESTSTTTATITSTATVQQTLTVPSYTDTTYSLIEPDTTVTSTSTQYVTYTVSRVSSVMETASSTGSRPSYSGPGFYGWNSSNPDPPSPTDIAAAADQSPQTTTLTEIHYLGEGDKTTSTFTRLFTTSMRVAYTTVLTPAIPVSSGGADVVTTVTALPVTITYSNGQGYSTSVALNSSVVSPVSTSSVVGPYQAGTTPSVSRTNASSLTAGLSSTAGIFTNSTGPTILSVASYAPGISQPSGLSTGGPSSNGTIVGSESTATSSNLEASSAVPTAPGPVSLIPSAVQTSSPSNSTAQKSSSFGTSTSKPSSSVASSNSSRLSVSSYNGTSVTSSASGAPTGNTSSSSSMRYMTSLPPSPAYGSYSSPGFLSTAATVGPASISSASASTSSTLSPSIQTASYSVLSGSPTLTPIRSISSLAQSSQASRSPSFGISGSPVASLNSTALSSTLSSGTLQASLTSASSSASLSSMIGLTRSTSSSTATSTTSLTGIPASAASSQPTSGCGEYGNFTLDFDNLPSFTPNDQKRTDVTQAPPIPNPYHHFTFSDGYVYAPDPNVPYDPVSDPHLAVFLGNGTGMRATQAPNTIEEGEFADGPYESSSAFWFDAFSGWLGCDNQGPQNCTIVMSGYTYSAKDKDEVLSFTQNATVPPCSRGLNCKLSKVEFPESFRDLSGLQMRAFVGQEERMFFMDDVDMRWSDNSCAAGLTRQRAR